MENKTPTAGSAPQENKMGVLPVGKLLANMAIPMMISMLFQALYNIVDSVFVAQLSQDALNAVSLEAEGFDRIAKLLKETNDGHRTLLTYSPDHGQHLTAGGNGAHGSKLLEDMNVLHFWGTI